MTPARYIMIGGFLGAGKTTAVLRLADTLHRDGLRVGLITNDQSIHLVDTARARAAGHAVEEITGGCFCCKFDSLVEASRELEKESAPDVFIAEPVGSCTDLKATVSYPLRELYGDRFRVAPLSVVVDPTRCAAVLGVREGRRFSSKVTYVYRKQLEEAEIIVINKVDAVEPDLVADLRVALEREFPGTTVLEASALSGAGVEAWFEQLLTGELGEGDAMAIDYDEYAEGEALLGWVNLRGPLRFPAEAEAHPWLVKLADEILAGLEQRGAEVAHLKLILAPPGSPSVASVSATRGGEGPTVTHEIGGVVDGGDLLVNLRAEGDPELLESIVLAALEGREDASFEATDRAAFRPGRPEPTHRFGAASG